MTPEDWTGLTDAQRAERAIAHYFRCREAKWLSVGGGDEADMQVEELDEMFASYRASLEAAPVPDAEAGVSESDVEWIAFEDGDLGVRVFGEVFTLYKGESLHRTEGRFRRVGKREYGEACKATYPDDPWIPDREWRDVHKEPR